MTSSIKPMNQGVLSAFIVYSLRWTFGQVIDAITRDHAFIFFIVEFWKKYDMHQKTFEHHGMR